jgi:hypothetical protein
MSIHAYKGWKRDLAIVIALVVILALLKLKVL